MGKHALSIPTASQTVGPYFSIGLGWRSGDDLAARCPDEAPIELSGRLLDSDGDGVTDALVEIWQADVRGHYPHPEDPLVDDDIDYFVGTGRSETDVNGEFRFRTIKPGRVPAAGGGLQAPHVCLTIFARGLLRHLNTRVYFADESEANAEDEVLGLVPEHRRATLIARPIDGAYRIDLVLQGPNEAVFFDF